jgi:selenocysteine lyase/cysteine desulfurase
LARAVKEQARSLLANLLGARPEQVAFMRNTSDALSTVANGLQWRPGDNIVTFSREFPSNIYPWLRIRDAFGVEVRMCEERDGRIDRKELESLIDQNTRGCNQSRSVRLRLSHRSRTLGRSRDNTTLIRRRRNSGAWV